MRVPPPGDAVAALRVRLSAPQSREARYYAAVHADTVQRGARAAMALADAELAEMQAALEMSERLLATMDHWADVADTCERKANESHARREAVEARLAAVEALHRPTSAVADPWCRADGQTWPCPTTVALRGES